jgi:hypothetical protein
MVLIGACATFFFARAGLAAREFGANVRGAMYCLVFMVARRSKAREKKNGVIWRQ